MQNIHFLMANLISKRSLGLRINPCIGGGHDVSIHHAVQCEGMLFPEENSHFSQSTLNIHSLKLL